MSQESKTPLLDRIHTPDDLRRLDESQLRQVADELRTETDEREEHELSHVEDGDRSITKYSDGLDTV